MCIYACSLSMYIHMHTCVHVSNTSTATQKATENPTKPKTHLQEIVHIEHPVPLAVLEPRRLLHPHPRQLVREGHGNALHDHVVVMRVDLGPRAGEGGANGVLLCVCVHVHECVCVKIFCWGGPWALASRRERDCHKGYIYL